MMIALRHRLEYGALRVIVAAIGMVPLSQARAFGGWLGRLGYRPLGIRRKVVERQLAAAFPGLDASGIDTLARASYSHLGRVGVEQALLRGLGADGLLALFEPNDDFHVVQAAMQRGKGLIVFTGHLGNWEAMGAYLARRGVPLDAVVRRMANPLFDRYLNSTRKAHGMVVVADREAVRRVPRTLREGKAVALVADQGVLGLASTYATFFGRPAKTPRGPAVFALRLGSPIVFCAALLQPSGLYRFIAEEIQAANTGDREADVDTTVARFTQALERVVRRYPEQYFWQHRRWKRQPPDTPAELRDPVSASSVHQGSDY